MEPVTPSLFADLLGTGAKYQVDQTQSTRLRDFLLSDDECEEDILGAGEEIDEEPLNPNTEAHHQSPPTQADKP
ncbi:hypothetical protein Tco_1184367 [Tanacetum coccineum]